MCDSFGHTIEPIITLTLYPVIACDAILGIRNFVRLMKRLKSARTEFYSVKLSAAVITLCAFAGCMYGPLSHPRSDGSKLILLCIGLMLYAFPFVDYLLKKNKSRWDNWLYLPFSIGVLLAGSYCVAALFCASGYPNSFN